MVVTSLWLPKILRTDLGQESLTDASDWADDYDHSAAGKWSAPLHYIDYPGQVSAGPWTVARIGKRGVKMLQMLLSLQVPCESVQRKRGIQSLVQIVFEDCRPADRF